MVKNPHLTPFWRLTILPDCPFPNAQKTKKLDDLFFATKVSGTSPGVLKPHITNNPLRVVNTDVRNCKQGRFR